MSLVLNKDDFTPFYLEDLYNKYENQYKYNFSSACMPIKSLEELFQTNELKEIFAAIAKLKLDYTYALPHENLTSALKEKLYPKNNVFITTTGASEAIYLTFKALFQADDAIIVQKPIYQSLYQVAQDAGIEVIDWHLKNNSWDFHELEYLLKQNPKIKALVINNPNNPTGFAFTDTEIKELGKILDGRLLIADEVFQPLALNNCSNVAQLIENSISICDLSKSFSMPGLRLGWLVIKQKKQQEKIIAYKNYLSLRTNIVSEFLASKVLEKSSQIIANNKNILKKNIETLFALNKEDLFFDLEIKQEKISGLTIFPKIKSKFKKLDFDELLEKHKIFLAFGNNFGLEYQDHCRLGLGNIADVQQILKFAKISL